MADSPLPEDGNVPQNTDVTDLKSLNELRDQLGDYLSTLERNTDSVATWLVEKKSDIILYHQKLVRALTAKDEGEAVNLLNRMGEIAGFVVSIQDFKTKGEAAFGKNSKFSDALAGLTERFPAYLQEELPELPQEALSVLPRVLQDNRPIAPAEQRKWWASVTDWFNKAEKERIAAERQVRLQLHAAKAEILGMQDERHYYIDSFMDWVADSLAPEAFGADAKPLENTEKMLQYQNPAYVVGLAHDDHQEVLEQKSQELVALTVDYSAAASAIDTQNINGIINTIRGAYPARDTAGSKLFRDLLLNDYRAGSLAELIVKHVKGREAQARLLKETVDIVAKEKLSFADARTPKEIFEKFLSMALDARDPLPPSTLYQILSTLEIQTKTTIHDLAFGTAADAPNVFQRVVARFENDLPRQTALLAALLHKDNSADIAETCVRLKSSLTRRDANDVASVLREIKTKNNALEVVSLFYLTYPGTSLTESLRAVSSDAAVNSSLMGMAIKTGILSELRMESNTPYGYGYAAALNPARKFEAIVEKDILPALNEYDVSTARLLLAHTFSTGGLEGLRSRLTASGGWLETIVGAGIDYDLTASWIAAFLEPFRSPIVQANILHDAALSARNPQLQKELLLAEENLVGKNIRLDQNTLLTNLGNIANIWYNADDGKTGSLRYTVQGASQTLLDDVTPDMAQEILSLIKRRGGFWSEKSGLFNPENVDIIGQNEKGDWLMWHRAMGPLNVDRTTLEELHSHPGFLHVTNPETGFTDSYNLSSICLLQEMSDGTSLMIDKYGTAHTLEGTLTAAGIDTRFHFNPANAAIVRLNEKTGTLEFHIESTEFSKLLETDDDFFYSVDLSGAPAKLKAVAQSIKETPDLHALKGASAGGLHFNLAALGYLAYDEKKGGFLCRHYSSSNRPGLIQVDDDMVDDILTSLRGKPGVVAADDLLVHENSIDNAYMISEGSAARLKIVMGRDVEDVDLPTDEARKVLAQLLANGAFAEAGSPDDIVNLGRTTLVTHLSGQGKTQIITDSLPIQVNLAGSYAHGFLSALESAGLPPEKKDAGWTQSLDVAAFHLSTLAVPVAPYVRANMEQKKLLGQALSEVKSIESPLRSTFATVAKLPAPGQIFSYPEKSTLPPVKHPVAVAKGRKKGPGL